MKDAAFGFDDEISNLEIVFKISERCNLACDYCYFFFHGDDSWRDRPSIVSADVIDGLAQFVADGISRYNIKQVNFVLHGGEPLMLPKIKFAAMCEKLLACKTSKTEINFAMQTNGALVTPTWIDLLAKYNVGCGVSMDGPASIHDVHRRDTRGRPSYAECRRGWDLLLESSRRGIGVKPALLAVIDPAVDANTVFDHFVDDMGADFINFLLPYDTHDDPKSERVVQGVGQFLIDIFDNWAARGRPDIRMRFIRETFHLLCRPEVLSARRVPAHDLRNQMTISSDGTVFPEDTIKKLSHYQTSPFSVFNSTLEDVFSSQTWLDLKDAALRLPAACGGCSWRKVCNGGRTVNRYAHSNKFDNPSIFCDGLKDYFEHITAVAVLSGVDLDRLTESLHGARLA